MWVQFQQDKIEIGGTSGLGSIFNIIHPVSVLGHYWVGSELRLQRICRRDFLEFDDYGVNEIAHINGPFGTYQSIQ